MSIQSINNNKMVIIPSKIVTSLQGAPDTRTQQVAKKSFGEKIFDLIRAGIGEMPSGPFAVELLQYEQNSMMHSLGARFLS